MRCQYVVSQNELYTLAEPVNDNKLTATLSIHFVKIGYFQSYECWLRATLYETHYIAEC